MILKNYKYFYKIFAFISISIMLEFGFDFIDRVKVGILGIEAFDDEYYCYESDMYGSDVRLWFPDETDYYEFNKVLFEYDFNTKLVLESMERYDGTYRLHFIAYGSSGYFGGQINTLDKLTDVEVDTDAGKFYLDYVSKKKEEKDIVSYCYDMKDADGLKNIPDINKINFTVDNYYIKMYSREFYEITNTHIVVAVIFTLMLWMATRMRISRKQEWLASYDEDYIKLFPDLGDQGYSQYKYTLTGAVIKSVAWGCTLAIVLYLLRDAVIYVLSRMTLGTIWIFTGGSYTGFIAICATVTTLIALKRMDKEIIEELD